MRDMKRHAAMILLTLVAALSTPAANASDDDIGYTVRSGDTLIGLAKLYLIKPDSYQQVQRYNAIKDPLAIPVGRVVQFPRDALKYIPATAKLLSVRGRVLVNNSANAVAGQILREGSRLATAESSFATILLDNGSRLSLPSNSDIRITRLRTYVLGGSLDYDFDIDKGGARSAVNALKSPDDRYRVRTPKAVSAVRGTDFQSRYDPATDKDFAEVIEGGLAVGVSGNAILKLPAGNGLAVPKNGAVITETLLPAPALIEPGRRQSDAEVKFAPSPTPAAAGYRYTLSSDAGFVDQVADIKASIEAVSFADIADGNYFVRARAISASGIEGIPATFAFKRRLNAVSATADAGDNGFVFKWSAQGKGVSEYHFQLFRGSKDSIAMVDEAALISDQISLSDLPPGDYYWRVGSVQYQDGEVATNWTPFEKLNIGAS